MCALLTATPVAPSIHAAARALNVGVGVCTY